MPVFDFLSDSKRKADKRIEDVALERIVPNPNQPRATFDDETIAELAQSIDQVGLIQPILVHKQGDMYELVAGERRLRAVKSLGWTSVTCIVQSSMEEEASAMMSLIENLQREDLYFLEEAACYSTLLSTYNLTQEQLAERLGKSQSSIANKLRILKLSPGVKQAMQTAGLTERHARALIQLKDEAHQMDIINKVIERGLSVKETEKLVEKKLNKLYDEKADGATPRPIIVRLVKDYRLFMNTINTAVKQLREADMVVEVDQTDEPNGVNINIRVRRK
ncbi:MAG: ParB/RepB/Spo0J family partition protein [Clostridia bacterium]